MKPHKLLILSGLSIFIVASLLSCSDDKLDNQDKKQTSNSEHIWKQQTDALQDAKDAAKKMQDNLNQQQQKMDQSN